MTNNKTCLLFLCFLCSCHSPILYCQDLSAERPNIVFFLVDDLGWQDTSVAFWEKPTAFQQHFRTPNVARLARQGIRFSRAYSCSVCSPTRTSILTGQNAARHKVTNWTFSLNRDTSGQTNRLLPPKDWNRSGLQPQQLNLPQLLKSVGYKTIHCGKAHWGAEGTLGSDPLQLGFDVNIAGHHAGAPGSYQGLANYGADPNKPNRLRWAVPGLEKYHGTKTHLTDALASEAKIAIENAVKEQKPFFLYMAPYAVHTPIQQHVRFIGNYLGKQYANGQNIPEREAKYASLVEGFDDALGQILKQLDKLGQAENTIVVFTSDNGGLSAHGRGRSPRGTGKDTHCWPLREGKGSAYEGGIRVPLVVSWAKRADNPLQSKLPIIAGDRTDSMVICEDYLPTICRWGGVQIFDAAKQIAANSGSTFALPIVDGVDITPAVLSKGKPDDRTLFFHYPHVWGPVGEGYQPHTTLISGSDKLIYFYHSRRWELYDLKNDIGENRDLLIDVGSHEKFKKLAFQFEEQLKKFSAQLPELKPDSNYIRNQLDREIHLRPVASRESRGRLAGWGAGRTWMDQHHDINKIPSSESVDLIFIGDSITQGWGGPGRKVGTVAPEVWAKYYQERQAVNFGISGDGFRNVLWRIEKGNLDGTNPRVIVLNIGTNDLRNDDANLIAHGIEQVVLRIEERRGRSKVLLLGIFPRGEMPDNPMRRKVQQVNKLLQKVADGRKTFFLDIGEQFVDESGRALKSHYRDDFLHLSPAGYEAWAAAIESFIVANIDD